MRKQFKLLIMGILILTLLIATPLSVSGNNNHLLKQSSMSDDESFHPFFTDVLVRIDISDGNPNLPRDIEIIGGKPGEYIDIITPWYNLYDLSNANIDYSVLIEDVEGYSDQFRGQYHTLAEMEQILFGIAASYPDITSLYSIGTTYEGRDIWCLEITDNPGVDEGEPGVFYMGLHHAREWPTLEICLHIADKLTSEYGSNPDITDVVDNRRLWLVTCVNPDGYHWDHDLGHDWRKNRHYFPEFGTYGVDLNRNYAGSCNGDVWGAWGSIGPGSVTHNPDYSTYCGPGPISELEAQAMRDIFLENDICACITWHTYSELVMWPWGYTYSSAPDVSYMSYIGQQIASRITCQSGSGTYDPTQSSGLYPTTGDTTDWAYGHSHYIQGRPLFAYTIEACSEFQPPAYRLDQICSENFDGALYFLQEAENIRDTVSSRVLPPIINSISQEPDGSYTVSWVEQNPIANPDYFQLDELTDLTIVTDNAESGSGLWNLDGFTLSTSRSHSSSHSYKSRYSNEDVSSMTTNDPLPVSFGTQLSFWCWYDIEDNWDYAMVEVSRDGRLYDVLDTFTGYSSGWQQKTYDLSIYAGESVFIRFRYTTDSNTQDEGFYVDDISPIADFGTATTLSSSITEHYYEISGNLEGDYYYQVKGHNVERGWGDFSTLEMIHVEDSIVLVDGYCYYPDMQPVNTVEVEIINLDTGERWQADTLNNYYSLILLPGDNINADETLRFIAKDGDESINVTSHLVTEAEIGIGNIHIDLILDIHYRDLKDFPFYLYEVDSGAMVMKKMMDYLMWNSTTHPDGPPSVYSEQDIYNAYAGGDHIDGDELWQGLNTEIDDHGHGWIYGYFFNPAFDYDVNEVLKRICIWLDYPVDYYNDYREVDVPKPGHPNHVPIAIPAYGGYSNWMGLRGIHTDQNCWPPSEIVDLNVYGFWLNDPMLGGIGDNTYVTAQRFLDVYFLQMDTTDRFDGQYLAITDPPRDIDVDMGSSKVTMVKTSAELTQRELNIIKQSRINGGIVKYLANNIIIESAFEQALDVLKHDCEFAESFEQAKVVLKPVYNEGEYTVTFENNGVTFDIILNKLVDLLEIQIEGSSSDTTK